MSTKAQHESMMNVCILGTGVFIAVMNIPKLTANELAQSCIALALIAVVGFFSYFGGHSDAKRSVPKTIPNNQTNEVEF